MPFIPRSTIKEFIVEYEKLLNNYSIKKYTRGELLNVFVLNDSLVILVEAIQYKAHLCTNAEEMYSDHRSNPYLEFPIEGEDYYFLRIEELTHNDIGFKYNHAKFVRKMEEMTSIRYLDTALSYGRFTSYREDYWLFRCPGNHSTEDRVDKYFPDLGLKSRIETWEGELYYFIVLELEDNEGNIHRTIAHTTQMPHSYVDNLCKTWIATGRLRGNSVDTGYVERDIQNAFASWKGIRRQTRLEQHLKYFYFEKALKSKDDAWPYRRKLLERVNSGDYSYISRNDYVCPVNKWVSEELVYHITKKYFKNYAVLYQHRPYFLRSSKNGQMSYDIFISKLNVAIEYQGRQHFEPVDFFGGRKSFEEGRRRDQEKARLSKENGIKLVYINYDEDITPSLIIERVGFDPRKSCG